MSQQDPSISGGDQPTPEPPPPGAPLANDTVRVPPAVSDARGRHDPALRATGFSGVSRGVTLTQWLEMVEVGRRDAQICLRDKEGNLGFLWCKAGEIIDAETGALRAEEAVHRILELESGEVSIEFRPCERTRTIQTTTFALLWQGARRGSHSSTLNTSLSALGFGVGGRAPAAIPPAALARRTPSVPPLRAQRSDTGTLPSIRPHTASIRPSSKLPPPGSAALNTWSQQRAFGLALAFIGGLAGVWLLSRIPARPALLGGSAASPSAAAPRPAAPSVASSALLQAPRPPAPLAATTTAKPQAAVQPPSAASVTVTPVPVAGAEPVRAPQSAPRPAAVRESAPGPRSASMSIELTRVTKAPPTPAVNNGTLPAATTPALRNAASAPAKKPDPLPIATERTPTQAAGASAPSASAPPRVRIVD